MSSVLVINFSDYCDKGFFILIEMPPTKGRNLRNFNEVDANCLFTETKKLTVSFDDSAGILHFFQEKVVFRKKTKTKKN